MQSQITLWSILSVALLWLMFETRWTNITLLKSYDYSGIDELWQWENVNNRLDNTSFMDKHLMAVVGGLIAYVVASALIPKLKVQKLSQMPKHITRKIQHISFTPEMNEANILIGQTQIRPILVNQGRQREWTCRNFHKVG